MNRDFKYTFDVDGVEAVATISPCSWMYPTYGLQVEVVVAGGRAFFNSRTPFADAHEADAIALAQQVKIAPCVQCAGPAIAEHMAGNRAGQCEACFMVKLNAKFAAEDAKAKKKEAAADAKMKAKGYAFKTVAWVHPKQGGDDYTLTAYTAAKPAPGEIEGLLRRKGSAVTNDYHVEAL